MIQSQAYAYSWHVDQEEEECTSIRMYGLTTENKSVCLHIDGFTPYVYIELNSPGVKWTVSKAQLLGDCLDRQITTSQDPLAQLQKPLRKVLVWKKKLYGAHLDLDTGERKLFPYLFCNFAHPKYIRALYYKLGKPLRVPGVGLVRLKIHESDASPILQLVCCRKLETAGWISFKGRKVKSRAQETRCDEEYRVKYTNLIKHNSTQFPRPKIMGFDIEVNSSNPKTMPNAHRPDDKIFQISCIFSREGDPEEEYEKYILSLGDPDQETTGNDVIIYTYPTEAYLLEGFVKLINEESPNIIAGYNILGFDIPYMIKRAKRECCIYSFSLQGFHKTATAKEKIIKWSSSAFRNQEFEFLDAEGRVYVDLLPLVQRDYKFNNYKLKTVSTHFLGHTKEDLSVQGIFKCYRLGMKVEEDTGKPTKQAQKAMGICARYCVKDGLLVNQLMDVLKTWVGLTEMAKCCYVPIFNLYTQGQQIKVYSQLYMYCLENNIVVEKDAYQVGINERYMGAKVFDPVPGKYSMVVPLDFMSLYPSTIIAYNIDYHTWVQDDSGIPDSMCHVMEWDEHQGCTHDPKYQRRVEIDQYIEGEKSKLTNLRKQRDKCKSKDKARRARLVEQINQITSDLKPFTTERSELVKSLAGQIMCAHRRYRFLKEPRGVMPTVIQNLLDARKKTRKVDMVACKKEIKRLENDTELTDEDKVSLIQAQRTLLDVLDKRQLSFKVASNSMYGTFGVRRGYLPFMPAAMVTTYMGRTNIEIVAKTITEQYGGNLVYGEQLPQQVEILC
jgi:DNA polymerase elongation subunit (family B)